MTLKETSRLKFFLSIVVTLFLFWQTAMAYSQPMSSEGEHPHVKTVYVDYFGHGDKAISFKSHLESYLQEYGFYLTRNRYQADAVISGFYRNANEQLLSTADRSPVSIKPGRSFAVENSSDPGIRVNIIAQKPHQDETLWQFASKGFFNKRLAHKTAKNFSQVFYQH